MNSGPRNIAIVAALLGALVASSVAQADYTADVTGWIGGTGTAVLWHGSQVVTTTYGGALLWTQLNPNSPDLLAYQTNGLSPTYGSYPAGWPNGDASNFISFCIEIGQDVTVPGSHDYTQPLADLSTAPVGSGGGILPPDAPMGALAANLIEQLWYQHMDAVAPTNSSSALYSNTNVGAFQLAIWKLVYDQGATSTLETGNLTAGASAETTLADLWLSQLTYSVQSTGVANLAAFTSSGLQDQVVAMVPEASSVSIWSLLCVATGLVVHRRRKVRQ